MTDRIQELLNNPQNPETITLSWPIIKEILVEQSLILVSSNEDTGSLQLKGFATAYRALEAFHIKGREAITK
jgi:hypothetical protein